MIVFLREKEKGECKQENMYVLARLLILYAYRHSIRQEGTQPQQLRQTHTVQTMEFVQLIEYMRFKNSIF